MNSAAHQASTRFSIVKRSKGQSAVEKASYISQIEIFNEFDGQTYHPKYHEDLVHSEIRLPENVPKEFADRAVLWNSVERTENGQKAQLARMLKASLPNEWSYEVAKETSAKPDREFSKKYGNTLYHVRIFFKHERNTTAEDKIKRLILEEIKKDSLNP